MERAMKKISIITPTFHEEENVAAAISEVREVFRGLPRYDYEHIFIDNDSTDKTVEILKEYAKTDPRVKIIVNARNFGQSRSPHYALLQSSDYDGGHCLSKRETQDIIRRATDD